MGPSFGLVPEDEAVEDVLSELDLFLAHGGNGFKLETQVITRLALVLTEDELGSVQKRAFLKSCARIGRFDLMVKSVQPSAVSFQLSHFQKTKYWFGFSAQKEILEILTQRHGDTEDDEEQINTNNSK